MATLKTTQHAGVWEQILDFWAPILTAATFFFARVIELFEDRLHLENNQVGVVIKVLADLALIALCCEILVYLVRERSGLLRQIERTLMSEMNPQLTAVSNDTRQLARLATRDDVEKIVARENTSLLHEIVKPTSLSYLGSSIETYTAACETIQSVSVRVPGQKDLALCVLYTGIPQPSPSATLGSTQSHFDRFDEAMKNCAASEGKSRWNVRVLYNVTSPERLQVVLGRLNEGTEGYQVRAIVMPNIVAQLSPLIVGDEDSFLATVNYQSYRIDAGVHLRGKAAVAFIKRFVDSLWEDKRVFSLRREDGIDENEVERLKSAVRALKLTTAKAPQSHA